jgi:hypothetical protein
LSEVTRSFVATTPTPTPTAINAYLPLVRRDDLPDLIVAWMSIRLDTPCLAPGSRLGLSVTVANIGAAAAGPFEVEANGALQTVSDGLAAGQSVELWFPGYVAFGPNSAVADATHLIAERDETNNQLVQQVPIPTPPAPCPTMTPTILTR